MAQNTKHAVMSSALAKALMESGVQHFDTGGGVISGGSSGAGALGGLAGALTTQNGYQAQLAPTQTSDYGNTIAGAQTNALAGFNTAQGIQGQQQGLANTLLAQSQGQGPNVAQSALNQNTGNNVAQQAALMGSQRGGSANPGLIARQAAMQGAATQQTAAGQAATLQAQQQIAAQQALAQQQAAMAQGNVSEQGAQQNLFNTAAGAQNTQNANAIQNANMVQGINSQVGQNNANAVNKTGGGLLGGIASSIPVVGGLLGGLFYEGGEVSDPKAMSKMPSSIHKIAKIYHPQKFADGGDVIGGGSVSVPGMANLSNAGYAVSAPPKLTTPKSKDNDVPGYMMPQIGEQVNNPMAPTLGNFSLTGAPSAPAQYGPSLGQIGSLGYDEGGNVGEVANVSSTKLDSGGGGSSDGGGASGMASMLPMLLAASGGNVPGKSQFKGNDKRNDVVPAILSKGEDVLPLSVTQSSNPPEKAKEFVQHLMEEQESKKSSKKGYEKIAESKKSLKERVEALEKCMGGAA